MAVSEEDLRASKRGVATLVAVLVQTIQQSDPTFQARFVERMGLAYGELRDNSEVNEIHGLELLSWTRELLTGFSQFTGQGEPFLHGR